MLGKGLWSGGHEATGGCGRRWGRAEPFLTAGAAWCLRLNRFQGWGLPPFPCLKIEVSAACLKAAPLLASARPLLADSALIAVGNFPLPPPLYRPRVLLAQCVGPSGWKWCGPRVGVQKKGGISESWGLSGVSVCFVHPPALILQPRAGISQHCRASSSANCKQSIFPTPSTLPPPPSPSPSPLLPRSALQAPPHCDFGSSVGFPPQSQSPCT